VTTAVREAPAVAEALTRAREQTLRLIEPLDDELLVAQLSPLQSPLVWDLAHIGWFEELWLVRRLGGDPLLEGFDDLYDAFRHERAERSGLPILSPAEARAYLDRVRAESLRVLEDVAFSDDPLLRDAYVYGLVVQHELQHQETMLQTIRLSGVEFPAPPLELQPGAHDVLVPAGPFTLGSDEPWAYDNERPAHVVELPAYRIERNPVTNERFAEFVEEGGYRTRGFWSEEGWRWLQSEQDRQRPLEVVPSEPVQHVSFYEAEAVAAWAGKRLPSEAEWEKAAKKHGHAPLVWEWTSSPFTGYPGFEAFPYPEYSEVFFGDDYRVLRGGSWATDPLVARVTFRNWDLPQRRQIFSGVRLAADA
jgi:gamma-glutamyl hercynylcysteine S-oxide synthase